MKTFFAIIGLFVTSNALAAVKLTPQAVVDQVLGKSPRAESIQLNNQLAQIGLEKAKGKFDLTFGLSANYQYDESEDLSGLSNLMDKTYSVKTEITKPTSLGTTFTFGYNHIEQSSVLNSIIANSRTPTAALDEAGLTIRQNLWKNFFGKADRLAVEVERSAIREADLRREEQLETLTLDAMRLYWDTYVAQVQLRDALASRERYQSLMGVVSRKSRFGLQRGGEAAQIQAEVQDADQKAKRASNIYLALIDKLKTLIQLELGPKDDIEFVVATEVPPLPRLETIDEARLREVRMAQSAVETARLRTRNVNIAGGPTFDLIASAKSTGVETDFDRSYAELTSGTKPTYFVGFEFKTGLDSSSTRADLARERVNQMIEENKLHQLQLGVRDQRAELENRVRANFDIAKSAIEAYRSRTLREQESDYRGGRLALAELIRTYNSYLDSQSRRVRAVGDYHIALNELAAFRDELVKEK